MSAKSVEVVRAVFDTAVEGDRARVLALHGPEVEYDVTGPGSRE